MENTTQKQQLDTKARQKRKISQHARHAKLLTGDERRKRTGQFGQAHCPGAQVQLPVVLQLQVWVAWVEGLLLVSEEAPVVGPLLVPEPAPELLSAMVLAFFESMSDIVSCGLWVVW